MGLTQSSTVRKAPPAFPESAIKEEAEPHLDARRLAGVRQNFGRQDGDVLACVSSPENMDEVTTLTSEEGAAAMQISGHGSVSRQACNVEQSSVVPLEEYNKLCRDRQFILQQLDDEKRRTWEIASCLEAREQGMTKLLHFVQLDNVESLAQNYRYYYQQTFHLRKEVMEYQKKCKDLSFKIEQLEHLHSQKAIADSGSYQDSAATPPLLQTAVDGVNDAIAVCASELFVRFKKNAHVISNIVQLVIPVELRNPSNLKVSLQAFLCMMIFKGFGDPYFSLRDILIPPFEIPSRRKSWLFQAFRRCRDREVQQLFDEDNDFKHFVHAKAYEISEEIKLRLLSDNDTNGKFGDLDLLNSNDRNLHCKFLRLAKAVWVLHKLALAFEPSAEILYVSSGSSFDDEFMEDMGHDEEVEEDENMVNRKPHKPVRFMCVPGFTVRHTVIKSRVLCLPDMQPQACSISKKDGTSMQVVEETSYLE